MTRLVVDSSVAIKWFIVEPHSPQARRILTDYQNGAINFHAPDLINAEFGNIVWKKHIFQGLAADDAQAIINGFTKLSFALTSTANILDDAYRLAITYRRSVYDSLYLALSIREQCRFVTADEKMCNAISSSFSNLIWLGNWP